MQCGATTEGLCALHGSSACQVTRSADGRDLMDKALDRPSIDTCGWDPGKDDAEASLSDCETAFACPA